MEATALVERVEVLAYQIPSDGPDGKESDGTLEWDATTCVVVLASAGGQTGIVAAIDIALWDLRARLIGQPLYRTLPAFHDHVPVYGIFGLIPLVPFLYVLTGGSLW